MDYPVRSEQISMIRFINILPLIEYLLTFGLFAYMVVNYLLMVKSISESESKGNRLRNIRLITGLVVLAFLAAILMVAVTMIST